MPSDLFRAECVDKRFNARLGYAAGNHDFHFLTLSIKRE
jgi:hypothetical protein